MNAYIKILNILAIKHAIKPAGTYRRFSVGFHHTYALGKKLIVKIEDSSAKTLNHQKDFSKILLKKGAKIPEIIDFGKLEGKTYLVMKRLPGKTLACVLKKLTKRQRNAIFEEIAQQLKVFHSIKFKSYAIPVLFKKKTYQNLKDAIQESTNFNVINKSKFEFQYRKELKFLENFYKKNEHILNENNTAVLVHNDIHLENILIDKGKLSGIIDLDWICKAPRDYELWKLVDIAREPRHTVNGRLKPLLKNKGLTQEFKHLKHSYPELFLKPNLPDRIRLFYIQELINNRFLDFQNGIMLEEDFSRIKSEIKDIFRSDWLDKLLR